MIVFEAVEVEVVENVAQKNKALEFGFFKEGEEGGGPAHIGAQVNIGDNKRVDGFWAGDF